MESTLKFVLPRIKDSILRTKITGVLSETDEKFDPEDKKFEYAEAKLEVKEEEVLHLDTAKRPRRENRGATLFMDSPNAPIRSTTHHHPMALLRG